VADSTRLTCSTPTIDIDGNIYGFNHVDRGERTHCHLLLLLRLAVVRKLPLIDGEGTRTFLDTNAGCAGLSATSGEKFFGV